MPPIEEAAGVFRIAVFTPFGTGPTNAYVLRGDRVGLFDTGLRHPRAWADLRAGFAALGLDADDVDTVFVSHAHVDHHGLTHEFRGAAVVGGVADMAKLLDFPTHMRSYAEAVAAMLPRWGVPGVLVSRLGAPLRDLVEAGASVPTATGVSAGTVIDGFGSPLQVIDLPGHTEGGIGLLRDGDGILLAGDHLLEHITPNPGLFTTHDPVISGLGHYVASLGQLAGLGVELVLPGHGHPFAGMVRRIEEIIAHHVQRADRVEDAFSSGRSVFDVVGELFPGVDALNGFLAMSEVFGHAELLRDASRLEVVAEMPGEGEAVIYRRRRR